MTTARKTNWLEEQESLLFELHKEYGNKWSLIATKIGDKDVSSIKNKFYSTLRKGLRKMNKYIINIKKKADPVKFKAIKTLQEMFLTKVIAVTDENFTQKYEVKQKAIDLAPSIQQRIVQVAFDSEQYLKRQKHQYEREEDLWRDILEFNKNCKKRKGKRKQDRELGDYSDNQLSEDERKKVENIEGEEWKGKEELQRRSSARDKVTTPKESKKMQEQVVKSSSDRFKLPKKVECYQLTSPLFVNAVQKSQYETINSVSTSAGATGNNFAFASRYQEFLRVIEDNPLAQSNNLSMSSSWNYELNSSRQLNRQMSTHFLQPSPLAGDQASPFTFNNLMKSNNVEASNMFEDKNNSVDLFSSGKLGIIKKEDNFISLVQHFPVYKSEGMTSLVKSADLANSTQMQEVEQSPMCSLIGGKDVQGSIFGQGSERINQFLSSVNRPNLFGPNPDALLRDYSFANSSELRVEDEGEGLIKSLSNISE